MFGLYNDESMSPYYNFHFNEKSSDNFIWLKYIYKLKIWN
jgi:hypothetical protein